MRRFLFLALASILSFVVAACSGGGSGGGNGSGTANVTISPTVQIYPATLTLPAGTSQQFTATLVLPDGSKQDVTESATWSSSAQSIATVSDTAGSKGLVSTVAAGTSTITATTSGGVSGTATVKVAALTSISVTPSAATLPVGVTQAYTATGTFADQSTSDLTKQVTWTSSDATVATVSNTPGSKGIATSLASGTAVITATFGTVSGNGGITVNTATISSLAISPSGATAIAIGTTKRFMAAATYSDNSSHDVTTLAAWSVSPASVATVGPADANGRIPITGTAAGAATITATFGGKTATVPLSVTTATIVSLAADTGTSTVGLGVEDPRYTAIATFSDGSTQDVTDDAAWASSNESVAKIGAQVPVAGIVTPVAIGTTTVLAGYAGVAAPAQTLKVTTPEPHVFDSSPIQGTIGQRVAVRGTNFVKGGTTVTVGGVQAAKVDIASSSYLQFVVPDAVTGDNNAIVIHTAFPPDATSPQTYSVRPPAASPTITGVSPLLGPAGQIVVVEGTNFVRGGTHVRLGATDVGTVTVSGTQTLTFVVPAGLPNGDYAITVDTGAPPAAVQAAPAFTVGVPTGPPQISGMSPTYGPVGTYVVITGQNFVYGGTTVTIGGVDTTPSQFGGPQFFTVIVPNGASLVGTKVTVRTPYGTATSQNNFTVTTH